MLALSRFIFWYHDSVMINYDDQSSGNPGRDVDDQVKLPAGISVKSKQSADKKKTNSTLSIRNANPGHSGNYTCQPSNAIGASIQVFVSEGELI